MVLDCVLFFFKQKTAYEMRISDWSSDVCSSDLGRLREAGMDAADVQHAAVGGFQFRQESLGPEEWRQQVDVQGGLPILAREGVRRCQQLDGRVRSEERRVGNACFSTCRSRWSPIH